MDKAYLAFSFIATFKILLVRLSFNKSLPSAHSSSSLFSRLRTLGTKVKEREMSQIMKAYHLEPSYHLSFDWQVEDWLFLKPENWGQYV